jgi:hypothetical protein
MSKLPAFPPAAIPNGTAFIWWGVQVTILASRSIGVTDRFASLAKYHPKFFCCYGLQKQKARTAFASPGSCGTVIFDYEG